MTSQEVVLQALRELGLPEERIRQMWEMEGRLNPHSEIDKRIVIRDEDVPGMIAMVKRFWHYPPALQQQLKAEAESNIARQSANN